MKSLRLCLILIICATASLSQNNRDAEAVRYAPIYEDPDYAHPLPALREVVAEKAKSRKNTFYISKVNYFGNGASNAMVYWKEGRALILWEPHLTGSDRRHELVLSRRFLSLDKDVVPTLADVSGSNYLLPRELARRMVHDCVRAGQMFVISKGAHKHRKAQSNKALQLTAR